MSILTGPTNRQIQELAKKLQAQDQLTEQQALLVAKQQLIPITVQAIILELQQYNIIHRPGDSFYPDRYYNEFGHLIARGKLDQDFTYHIWTKQIAVCYDLYQAAQLVKLVADLIQLSQHTADTATFDRPSGFLDVVPYKEQNQTPENHQSQSLPQQQSLELQSTPVQNLQDSIPDS